MSSWKLLLLLGLLCSAQVLRAAAEDAAEASTEAEEADDAADDDDYAEATERAHLLVRKWIKEERGVQGRNVTVNVELYNAGNAAASDVVYTESKLPEGFEVIEGKTGASFAKLEVGSKASHSYVLSIKTAEGLVMFEPAKITYKADADGEEQATVSTLAYIECFTPTQQLQHYLLIGGKYASLGMMRTSKDWVWATAILGVLAVVFGGNSAYKSFNSARTDVRRKKALASLEKDE